ncbi:ABC transporter substrate-binding protein [Neomegalonema sp.]|uniref:ABC transporter substrate-binding protein n=1 Tax=Neomegalonema sp. TaxID=2039713 RepID=UPI002625B9F5|nr:ABC transporter substrate-binding protein [Neomegalonema sp.]MDD2867398.1 ABC transporter substrate-binding protein [Neomegalonema sp.]
MRSLSGFLPLAATAFLLQAPALSAAEAPAPVFDFSAEQAARPRAEASEAVAAALPEGFAFVEPGKLTVAVAPSVAPLAFYAEDARTPVGADPDIAQLLADKLGLELKLNAVAWVDWPLGLASGKYDAVISNVGVTEARKEKFDFSTYRLGLHGFYAGLNSGIAPIAEPKDVAGLRIIVGASTNQERILTLWDERNRAEGLKPVEFKYFDDEAASLLALAAGRADVIVQPHATLVYLAARDRNLRRLGVLSAGWPERSDVAVTTRKGSGLAPVLTLALNELIAEGLYARSLARWGVEAEALEVSETNPKGLPKF